MECFGNLHRRLHSGVSAVTITIGVDEPDASNVGVIPGSFLSVYNGDIIVSTPGQVVEDLIVNGFVKINAADVVVRNCVIRGYPSVPVVSTNLVDCTGPNCVDALIEDCEIYAQTPHWRWNTGMVGHDFTLRRCNVHHITDSVGVFNTHAPRPYPTGVVLEGCYLHDLTWWTAATSGVVHPSDTETHNDGVQHQGGFGTVIRGCRIDAFYARDAGHWQVSNPYAEPYVTVPLGLPDGPFQPIPNRGNGTEATGRYNFDDLACLMVNNNVGPSYGFVIEDNWFRGGNYALNAGGCAYTPGENFGTVHRNEFDRSQGAQSSGGNSTVTIALDSTWGAAGSTHYDFGVGTANQNIYMDDGAPVKVRTNQ